MVLYAPTIKKRGAVHIHNAHHNTGQLQLCYKLAKFIPAARQSGSPLLTPNLGYNWKRLHQSNSNQALTQFATHQKGGYTEINEQLETARLPNTFQG